MKNLNQFVNEEFEESDALEALIDEACDEFLSELKIDEEEDEEIREGLRTRAKGLKNKARKAVKNGASKLKSGAKNAKSNAKNFVKSLWTSKDHY